MPDPTAHVAPPAPAREVAIRAVAATIAAALVGAVVLCGAAVVVGLVLTRELLHGAVGRWDAEVTAWLVARRTPTRNDLSQIGSAFSETLTVITVVVLVVAFLAWKRHWPELGIFAIALAVEGVTYLTATYFVTRHRPQVPRLEDLIVSDSYFSGHAAAAVAMYGALAVVVWRLTRRRWLRVTMVAFAVAAFVAVALSRMYRGMHYASDVTIGALVGLGCIVVAMLSVRVGARAAARTSGPRRLDVADEDVEPARHEPAVGASR